MFSRTFRNHTSLHLLLIDARIIFLKPTASLPVFQNKSLIRVMAKPDLHDSLSFVCHTLNAWAMYDSPRCSS